MISSLDRALLAMSLEEEDVPFVLPDLPQYNSYCQKISNLIRDMPRKWQKYDKVHGMALTSERYQFIFKYEHDLVEILEKGVHTFNDWALAIER
ncbi:hypothetical protein N665_8505s0001 [Sinapis alba]|nr:hypothetical protein N665_8505s0001 [Sinapis alba]